MEDRLLWLYIMIDKSEINAFIIWLYFFNSNSNLWQQNRCLAKVANYIKSHLCDLRYCFVILFCWLNSCIWFACFSPPEYPHVNGRISAVILLSWCSAQCMNSIDSIALFLLALVPPSLTSSLTITMAIQMSETVPLGNTGCCPKSLMEPIKGWWISSIDVIDFTASSWTCIWR